MRIWLSITICLGIMADVPVLSLTAQGGTGQGQTLQDEVPQPGKEFSTLRRQLMWEQVESVKPSDNSQAEVLDELIHQLRSLKIPPKSISAEQDNSPSGQQANIASDTPLPDEVQPAKKEIETVSEPLNDIVAMLDKLDKVVKPLQLADVLFRQGHFEAAFKNYNIAYEHLSADRIADRQWVMFQKANCCRRIDCNESVRLYRELIESFPNSKWTTAANSHLKMIEWTQANQIKDLLEVEDNDPNSQ